MKFLNWSALSDDLLEILVMNQTTLASKCKVTQQSVSNWKTGTRSPGVYARHVLRELAKDAKLNIDDYKFTKKQFSAMSNESSKIKISEDILAFAQRISVLPKRQREKIIDMAEFMMTKPIK